MKKSHENTGLEGLNIIAYLRDAKEGCDYSGHFRKTWIENNKLHPLVKAIPVKVEPAMEETEIVLLRGHSPLLVQRENGVRPGLMQQFILDKLEAK